MKADFYSVFLLCFRSYSFIKIQVVIKERIQEIFEFTKNESPYSKANKGWINQDIFLDLSASSDTLEQKNEAARVTLLWSPISSLLYQIFLTIIMGSIIVFASLSFVHGRLKIDLFNPSLITDIVQVEDKQVLNTNDLDDSDTTYNKIANNIDSIDINKSIEINLSDENQINIDEKIINNQIEKKENIIKDIENGKDIENLKNKQSKSNFI